MKPVILRTRTWPEDSQAAKEYLRARGVVFEEVDIELHLVEGALAGTRRTSTFKVAGRAFHASPFRAEIPVAELGLAEALESST